MQAFSRRVSGSWAETGLSIQCSTDAMHYLDTNVNPAKIDDGLLGTAQSTIKDLATEISLNLRKIAEALDADKTSIDEQIVYYETTDYYQAMKMDQIM